ncbi:hypothetical protein [Sphingomonas pituitosa]|uniref:hypothetical protein n=1 Tax=Sphingomonas pituitosa TaxID=99597 RepID=UPI000831113B|nr:hypothetical protein [Sphingomonas pituitosa]
MSGFANSGDIPFLLGFVAVIATLTAAITISTRRARPNASSAAVAITSALALPAVVFALGFLAFVLMSTENSPDAAGMLLVGVLGMTIVALPVSLLTSVAVVSMHRR